MANHPDLIKKLKLLYHLRVNPRISSNTELAAEFGISKQAISRWIHGSETRHGNHIPATQLHNIATLFKLKEHWFALPYEEFEQHLFRRLEAAGDPSTSKPERISISQLPTTSAEVFGRSHELEMLDRAWESQQTNIVELVAFGGVGKSCLINHWLATLNERNFDGAKKIYAWSFYWQGASSDIQSSGDFFIEHALEWFGDPDSANGTPWAKASRLAKLIRQSKTLLILDGLEPLQFPPGPKFGHVQNPSVAFLIKELATDNNGLCVITTRLPVSDLAAFRADRTLTIQLEQLSIQASVKLLRSLNIEGSDADIQEAVSKYSCHPLSLTLLGGYLNIVYQGDIQKAHSLKSLFAEESHSDHAKNIMQAYLEWFDDTPESELLVLIGLMDRAVALNELQAIVKQVPITGLSDKLKSCSDVQWSFAIKRLCDARLAAEHEHSGRRQIECHPLVKEYAVEKFRHENFDKWQEGNKLLFEYYQHTIPEYPDVIADLDNLFRAVVHGTRAGLYHDAFQLYFFKIKNGFSMLSRGTHYADQSCLRTFFSDPWTQPVKELSEIQQIHLYSSVAANQMSLGNISAAIEPAEKSLHWFIANERWLEATTFAGPYISMLIAVGRIDKVVQVLQSLDPCVSHVDNAVLTAMGQIFHAFLEYLGGDNARAEEKFKSADDVIARPCPPSQVSFPTISSYYCKFLLETGRDQEALERLLKTFAWRHRKTWQVSIDTPSLYASDLLVLGLTFLAQGDLLNAKKHLDQQVELFRSADEWLYLPTGLHSRARYYIAVSNFAAARADLDEALEIATRTGAVFGEWESYLNFAHLHYIRNEPDMCWRYLQKAKSLPNMHRYKFRDSEIHTLETFVQEHSTRGMSMN